MYALFFGDVYYADGWAGDFKGWFSSIHEALEQWDLLEDKTNYWGHITDGQMQIVVKIKDCWG